MAKKSRRAGRAKRYEAQAESETIYNNVKQEASNLLDSIYLIINSTYNYVNKAMNDKLLPENKIQQSQVLISSLVKDVDSRQEALHKLNTETHNVVHSRVSDNDRLSRDISVAVRYDEWASTTSDVAMTTITDVLNILDNPPEIQEKLNNLMEK